MKDINSQLQKNIQDVLHYDKGNAVENIVKLVFETIMNAERSKFLSTSEGNKANGYYQRLAQEINKYFKLNIPQEAASGWCEVLEDKVSRTRKMLNGYR